MNNKRNKIYTYIIAVLGVNIIMFIITLLAMLLNFHDNFEKSPFFLVSLSMYLVISLTISIIGIVEYIKTKKSYDAQYAKYKIEHIRENQKRELSALMMTIVSSFLLYPIFPMLNAYFKSGLDKKQFETSRHEIKVKNIDTILGFKNVKSQLDKLPKVKEEIENIILVRKAELDVAYNCNTFILHLLEKNDIKFEIEYDELEVYYRGVNV